MDVGVIVKLILNLILVPIEEIGVNGAAFASVMCHLVAFTIGMTALRKTIKLDLTFTRFVVKPIISVTIMAICSYFTYLMLVGIIGMNLATIVAMIVAVIIYTLAIVALKIFTKDEILSFPKGDKILNILQRVKIY